MRSGIHPEYVECRVMCSCGNTFETRSTKPELHIELCSKCHPFFTGQQKFVDTGGRVQRFSDKFGGAATSVMAKAIAEKEARQKAHEEAETSRREAKVAKDTARAERERKFAKSQPREDEKAEPAASDEAAEAVAEAVVEVAEPAIDEAEAPAEAVAEATEAEAPEAVAEDSAEAVSEEPATEGEPEGEGDQETGETAE